MNNVTLQEIEECVFEKKIWKLDEETIKKATLSFSFLSDFANDKIIYGINTGFGPMAQFKIENSELNQLQYNLIRNHSSGMGKVLSERYGRSVLLARLNAFLQGNSGVSMDVINQIINFLNHRITPEIYEHGGVGASGDLVQLAHLGLNLIGEGFVYVKGERTPTATALKNAGIEPLKLKLRDGLAIINGTSCMSGIAAVNMIYAHRLLQWSIASSSMINEVICSFDDSFSVGLNGTKRHKGQSEIAKRMREFLADSKLTRTREELFKDDVEFKRVEFKNKIQEYYSIRCVPQILGPILDTIEYATEVVENEFNSTNDNPVVIPELDNVFHGGNFHGDYISLEMDKVKIVTTKLTMLAERQLNFLMNHNLNKKFPPFLNAGKLGFNFGFQGLQFTATSTTAECQTLSNSMYVHSIPNNNDNQDIVSMGTNSATMARKVINNGFQVMAIQIMALCQAIDLLEASEKAKLSTNTMKVYNLIRTEAAFIKEDVVQSEIMARVYRIIKDNNLDI